MSELETRIEGEPGTIRGVSAWLRDQLAGGADAVSGDVGRCRDRLAESWSGQAGSAARGRVETLSQRMATLSDVATTMASAVERLADALEAAQAETERALGIARDGDLRVTGTVVHAPAPAAAVPALPAGATPAEVAEHDQRLAAHDRATAQAATWEEAVGIVDDARQRWREAREEAEQTWRQNTGNISGLTIGLLSGAIEGAVVAQVSRWAAEGARIHAEEAAAMGRHLTAMTPDGRLTDARSHYYLLRQDQQYHLAEAERLEGKSTSGKAPVALSRGLGALALAGTGYAVYDDIQQGESPAQAAVSNGLGLVASIGAGAVAGGFIGTWIPVPIVGTVTGIVVGAAVGTVAGLLTSGMVDSMWEDSVDSGGDAWRVLEDGWREVTGTAGDTVSLVGDLAGGAGDLVEDAWDAIF